MSRLVIVSNRVPVPKTRGATAGGLAVALKDTLAPGALWFGWNGRITAQTPQVPSLVDSRGVIYATIDLSAEDYKRFYVGFANGALWPLLHFRVGLLHFRREDYQGYLDVNRAFAEALVKLLRPDDIVWIHDYQLIPLGRFLREHGVTNRLGFFLHVPFVPSSLINTIPVAAELISDFCHYDVAGFQTTEHANDFRDCAARQAHAIVRGEYVHVAGRTTRVITVPIGIDAKGFARESKRAARSPETARLIESLAGRALAIGVDRLDYSKGIPERIEGFARLFTRHPEHLSKVSFFQVAARSREEVDQYKALRRELDRLAGNLNGRFSQFDWTPLRYSTRAERRQVLAGFYRVARIGVVTPLRDGMNLVAKEFVAAQDEDDPGVLILSRFAGAAEELTDALIVNPYDPDEIADALHEALVMPREERKERHEALLRKVSTNTAAAYCGRFLEALRASADAPALGIQAVG
jgi:trehalose 6-phosphate synthase